MDVGTTTAIVVVDENKRVVDRISKKNFSEEEIVNYLAEKKKVVLITTDKAKIPSTIKKISARLNLGIYAPNKDLSIEYKKKFYTNKELKEILTNIHEMDAYISAYYALDNVKEVIQKTKRITSDESEQIKILRKYFRNMKLEPTAIYKNFKRESESNIKTREVKTSRKVRPKEKLKEIEYRIIVKPRVKTTKEKDRERELIKKVTYYINVINKLSEFIIKQHKNLVPKIEFAEKISDCKIDSVFIDKKEDLNKVYKYKKCFVYKDLKEDVCQIKHKNVYIVDDYEDLFNFVIIKSANKIAGLLTIALAIETLCC
jgi:predicted RNase H-like nuclease (RuvC/YqgF family)